MVSASKVYSGLGADIVYGIITLKMPQAPAGCPILGAIPARAGWGFSIEVNYPPKPEPGLDGAPACYYSAIQVQFDAARREELV